MTHAVDIGLVFATVSGLLYIALGAGVFTLQPRRRETALLGLFAVSFGLSFVVVDVLGIETERAFELREEVQVDPGRDDADGAAGP